MPNKKLVTRLKRSVSLHWWN